MSLWFSSQGLHRETVTLNVCSCEQCLSGPRVMLHHVTCTCPWNNGCLNIEHIYGLCCCPHNRMLCDRVWRQFEQQKHLVKRKDKLINLSNPFSQHECNRFLTNQVSFSSSTEQPFIFFFTFVSICGSMLENYMVLKTASQVMKEHTEILNNFSYYKCIYINICIAY